MFALDQYENISSVPHKRERKSKESPSLDVPYVQFVLYRMNMMTSKKIATAVFFFAGISQITAVITFDKMSPVRILENSPENTEIAIASGSGRAYRIRNTPVPFQIDAISGVITTTRSFDFEDATPNRYELTVSTSGGLLVTEDSAPLIVIIEDVNEPPVCASQFMQKQDKKSIDENFPMFNPIYQVPAKDSDSGDKLKYSVQSQSSGPTPNGWFFDVDGGIGFVFRNSSTPLDFDAGYQEFRLILRATDKGDLFCEGGLIIHINDLNDEEPIFEKIENDTIYVHENTLVGSIIEVFRATDRDANDHITYSFPRTSLMFNISSGTGALTLNKPLDYDDPDVHKAFTIIILATDGVHITPYPVTVVVLDEDEPPVCDPAISTGTGITLMVPETFPILTTLYTVLAKDPDENDSVKFEISSSSLKSDIFFVLNEDTGIISTTDQPLDYESDTKKFVISIMVRNVKSNPMSCTGLITISLQNENDELPVYKDLPSNPIEIPENLPSGTVILKVQATDRDVGDSVHYEFATAYPGYFIDEDSGEIKIAYPLDYEDPTVVYEQLLIVNAFDNDRVHISVAEITVRLTDVNDNYPQCDGYPNMIEVAETTPINTQLLQINCMDKDKDKTNNVLQYKMKPLDDFSANKFNLTNNIITTGPKGLDYDNVEFAGMQFKHTLLIEVSDSGTPSLTSTVTVIVRVTRVNEFRPDPVPNMFRVAENCPLDTLVGKVTFTDADWPFNNIKFTFAGGDYGNPPKFYIEPNTGIIKVRGSLDFEEKNMYTIMVQAMDLNNDLEPDPKNQLRNFTDVIILILNVNDEPPVCSPDVYEEIIYSTRKLSVVQLLCSDKDSPDSQLNYAIVSENKANRFWLKRNPLDNSPPSIESRENFQYNVFEGIQDPTVFQLLIEVTDELGGNKALQLSTTATVIIHVVPWTTTIPTTTTKATTTKFTTAVLIRSSYVWRPDGWFPAIITITAALFLLCLYALAWGLLKETSKQDSTNNNNYSNENPNFLPGNPTASNFFDGRAVDPVSGKHFLFNSNTGETKWIS
ncbi:cadherin-related family member 4-like isoform X2 [Pseudophryne corroboree]|uniref:cadherin-related family member 4-like isoform X2 n=1 Tax=Pseudophryne corroboree TaxID=495146 RepID=UPI003081F48C